MNRFASFVLCSAAAIAIAAPAVAASADYYLVIDGIEGEASSAAKVSNWSFGTSPAIPPGTSMGAGRVATAREAGSGMATGRVAAGDLDGDGLLDFAEAGRLDQVAPLSLTLPAGSEAAKQLCGKTDHFRGGHIVKSDGTVYDLSGLQASCTQTGGNAVIALTGSMRRKEFTGHVTLIK